MELSKHTGGSVVRIDGNTVVYPSRATYFFHGPFNMLLGGFAVCMSWHMRSLGGLGFLFASLALGAFGAMIFLGGWAAFRIDLRQLASTLKN